jgi:hypothetical protein
MAGEQKWTDDERELRAELTRVASARVTWQAAANITFDRAAALFRIGKDTEADNFRELAREFEDKHKAESVAQDAMLRKLGHK